MKRHHTLWIIIIAIVAIALWSRLKPSAHAEPQKQKTEKEVYAEKWQAIGELKYEERDLTNKAKDAKAKKDALLEELNATNEGEQ